MATDGNVELQTQPVSTNGQTNTINGNNVQYVDQNGNPIDPSTLDNVVYVDQNGNKIDNPNNTNNNQQQPEEVGEFTVSTNDVSTLTQIS